MVTVECPVCDEVLKIGESEFETTDEIYVRCPECDSRITVDDNGEAYYDDEEYDEDED